MVWRVYDSWSISVEMTPKSLVADIDRLVSLPEVSIKINHLLTQGNYTSAVSPI